MSTDALKELESASLWMAAMRGWIAGVLFGLAVLALYTVGEMLWRSPETAGEVLLTVPFMLPGFLVAGIMGATIALPGPILAASLLWLVERVSRRTRNLPFWLATGVVASLPSAWFLWNQSLGFTETGDPSPDPLTWGNLALPLLVLACGLVGAFFAWRYRQAELAE